MSELSPQAQEVFWAFNRSASGKPDDWHYLPAIAVALRAAASQLAYRHTDHIADGRIIEEKDLLDIADELEAQ